MADHDELCEKADVGSLCDCHCAGAKHAIRHTKGGVPGAGAVSKRAQKAAGSTGKAAVINNRAQPKEGSRVAPSAPSSFTKAKPDEPAKKATPAKKAAAGEAGPAMRKREDQAKPEMTVTSRRRNGDPVTETVAKPSTGGAGPSGESVKSNGAVRDNTPKSPDISEGTDIDKRALSKTKAVFHGTSAEVVHEGNVSEGTFVTHVRKGVGVIEKVGKRGQPHRVKWTSGDGSTFSAFSQDLVKGEYPRQAAANAAGEKAADSIAKGGDVRAAVNGMNLGDMAATTLELERRASVQRKNRATQGSAAKMQEAADLIRRMGANRVLEDDTPDRTPVTPGDKVTAGFTKGEVLRMERKNGIDGAVVQLVRGGPDEGTLPRWVPLTSIKKTKSRPAWG